VIFIFVMSRIAQASWVILQQPPFRSMVSNYSPMLSLLSRLSSPGFLPRPFHAGPAALRSGSSGSYRLLFLPPGLGSPPGLPQPVSVIGLWRPSFRGLEDGVESSGCMSASGRLGGSGVKEGLAWRGDGSKAGSAGELLLADGDTPGLSTGFVLNETVGGLGDPSKALSATSFEVLAASVRAVVPQVGCELGGGGSCGRPGEAGSSSVTP
jgi:hypothetical protein